jgi:hypothetical protein
MVCILTLPLSEANWNNYFRCILNDIDSNTRGLNGTILSSNGQTQTLIRAVEDRLRGNITTSAAQVIGNVLGAIIFYQNGVIQSENNVREQLTAH